MITLETKTTIPEGVLFRDLGGEAVLLELATGSYFGLDEVGIRIWTLLSQHRQVGPVLAALRNEYAVDEEQLHRDLVDFVDQLARHRLLAVDDSPIDEAPIDETPIDETPIDETNAQKA